MSFPLHQLVREGDVRGVRDFPAADLAREVNALDGDGMAPLMYALQSKAPSIEMVKLLLDGGADLKLESTGTYREGYTPMAYALTSGRPELVRELLRRGAGLHYRREKGYTAALDAVFGGLRYDDARLFEMLGILVENEVNLNAVTDYSESALRVLSRMGRFEAVDFLLRAGADAEQVKLSPLMMAVEVGSLEDVRREIDAGADLEAKDYWERTAWLIAIQTGNVEKASLLRDRGADVSAKGRCEKPPLFYAIENNRHEMLEWLIAQGSPIEVTDEFGDTALNCAVEHDNVRAVEVLIKAGDDVNRLRDDYSALYSICSREAGLRLLEAGADPRQLTHKGRRLLIGLGEVCERVEVSTEDFFAGRERRFGVSNPERMDVPFWEAMVRSGASAYRANTQCATDSHFKTPTWCANRFGQSITFLPDGRIVLIAGEHEDSYDSEFCIYNDVFVHHPDGRIEIFGYPEEVFPPTDFHTANLVGNFIWIVGSLGYGGKRREGFTPVYRLDLRSMAIEKVATTGENPGWIHNHATASGDGKSLRVTGGEALRMENDRQNFLKNTDEFVLNLETLEWRRSQGAVQLGVETSSAGD